LSGPSEKIIEGRVCEIVILSEETRPNISVAVSVYIDEVVAKQIIGFAICGFDIPIDGVH
jgi:hypothetical protein